MVRTAPRLILLVAACGAAPGCMPELRKPLSIEESRQFRAEALEVMRQAVTSNEPVLRMQALEAFQDVAPAEGIPFITDNIDNGYSGVSFAALMALGTIRESRGMDKVRILSEDTDANLRVAALYVLHRMGDQRRTSELAEVLMNNPDARVRANAALAIGRLGEKGSIKVLRTAGQREKKDAVKMQIREALAMLGDRHAIEELIFAGYSANPDQATLALMFLAGARTEQAEELFRFRLNHADQPEIRLQAARGLGLLGNDLGYDVACAHLYFKSPDRRRPTDPPTQQIARVRSLAALALEAIGSPDALGPLLQAFRQEDQSPTTRLAIARAAVRLINRNLDEPRPAGQQAPRPAIRPGLQAG